ncbi:hypothetical protein LguiB_002885 [Lonicera macranthoides]
MKGFTNSDGAILEESRECESIGFYILGEHLDVEVKGLVVEIVGGVRVDDGGVEEEIGIMGIVE